MRSFAKSMRLWQVLPLCLCLVAVGLASCDDSLDAESGQGLFYYPLHNFSKTADDVESTLIEKDELPEWLIPIVTDREENDPTTAVFAIEMSGKLVYNVYYYSKVLFARKVTSSSLEYDDLYYADGTRVTYQSGAGQEQIANNPEKWRMIYCANPPLFLSKTMRQELVKEDALPDWMDEMIEPCKKAAVCLLTRDGRQAYTIYGQLSFSVIYGFYYNDGTRCTAEDVRFFTQSNDNTIIYLRE